MGDGVIIAGGRSTRFGDQDKAVADLAGTPMIRRVADRIVDAVDGLVINCRTDQIDPIRSAMAGYDGSIRYAEDSQPDRGPVAGIETGLRAVDSEYAFVVACDMPFVQSGLASLLFDRAAGHDGAVPRLEDRWYQTTQAVYRAASMVEACRAALQRGEGKVLAPLETLDYVTVGDEAIAEYAERGTFENVNSRAEFEAAAERLE